FPLRVDIDVMYRQDFTQACNLQDFSDVGRGVVEMNGDVHPPQRRQKAQHAAGNELDPRQVEGQRFAVVFFDKGDDFRPACRQVDLVENVATAKADDGELSGLINFENVFARRHVNLVLVQNTGSGLAQRCQDQSTTSHI